MIRVKYLSIENVGPFEGTVNVLFNVQKNQPDIHIFTGINGSGKTTLLHMIAGMFDYFESEEVHKEYVSNDIHKRFHFFEYVKKQPKSISSCVLESRKSDEDFFLMSIYGCEHCKQVHQVIDKIKDKYITKKGEALKKDIETYKKAAMIQGTIENYSLKFAAFAYSGYRLVTNGKIQIEEEDNDNPLHLALEFVKDKDTGNKLSNWIISRYSKAAIEEVQGNKETADRYRAALNCLINSLNELTGGEFKFEIKTNPWKVAINYYGKDVSFDVLPDGLRSLLSWMGDLLMRLDKISWEDKSIPVNEQNIILFLDEIEVHLHPKWQYEILPLTHKIFPNAQIFVSTHSPFVLNSIDNAKIYKLKTEKGISTFDGEPILTSTGHSYSYIYENILETLNRFGPETTKDLKRFHEIDGELVQGNTQNESEFQTIVERLLAEGEEVTVAISSKLMRLKRITGKNYYNGKDK